MFESDLGRRPTVELDRPCVVEEGDLGLIITNHFGACRHGLGNVGGAELATGDSQVPNLLMIRAGCLSSLPALSTRS